MVTHGKNGGCLRDGGNYTWQALMIGDQLTLFLQKNRHLACIWVGIPRPSGIGGDS